MRSTGITVGSLSPAFATARHVRLAVKLAFAFTRPGRFPSALSQPYELLRYSLGGKRPIQTAHQTLSPLLRSEIPIFNLQFSIKSKCLKFKTFKIQLKFKT